MSDRRAIYQSVVWQYVCISLCAGFAASIWIARVPPLQNDSQSFAHGRNRPCGDVRSFSHVQSRSAVKLRPVLASHLG